MVAGGDGVTEKIIGEGVRFERIRQITGYLVGGLDRSTMVSAPKNTTA